MEDLLNKWISELASEVEIIQSEDINEEARANLVGFGITSERVKSWGSTSTSKFLKECSEIYKKSNKGESMVFYSWVDELASEVRISAVSERYGNLPFGCELNLCDLPTLVKGVLSVESGLYAKEASLNVWSTRI